MAKPDGAKLDGEVAFITGATAGFGEALARLFAAEGARIIITGRRSDRLEKLKSELGDNCLAVTLDVRDHDAVESAVSGLPQDFTEVSILINNAGASLPGGRDEYDPEVFEEAVTINLNSNYRLAAALKDKLAMSELPGGASIVGMASMSSLFGIEIVPGYGSAKTGLMGLTRVLAVRYARDNIRVNAIACGLIKSNMTAVMLDIPEMIQPHLDRTPLARLGEPADIAGPTLFLTSPAAAYITGQTLPVDGGFSVQG